MPKIEAVENGEGIDSIYLDFENAFYKVDRDLLLRKLKGLGVKGKLGIWIQSFLKNRPQQVLVDEKLPSIFTLPSAVQQGSVLGPVLFLIFISDISEGSESDLFIYVDDTKAVKNIESVEDVIKLQEDLYKLHQWSLKNNMVYDGGRLYPSDMEKTLI